MFYKNSLLLKTSSIPWSISILRPRCAQSRRPAGDVSVCAAGGGGCARVGTGGTCGSAARLSEGACPGPCRRRGYRRRPLPRGGRCFRADSRCPPVDSWCCSLNEEIDQVTIFLNI